jgi:hypothetical protein
MLCISMKPSVYLCFVLLAICCLEQQAWASDHPKNQNRQSNNPPLTDYWPHAPWRNDETNSVSTAKATAQKAQADRFRETRRELLQTVSDNQSESRPMGSEARRELRQQIHEAGKELYRQPSK